MSEAPFSASRNDSSKCQVSCKRVQWMSKWIAAAFSLFLGFIIAQAFRGYP